MIYKHKDTNRFVELVSSGNNYCIIIALKLFSELKINPSKSISLEDIYEAYSTMGKVFKGGKKEFKKFFKKSSPEEAKKNGYMLVPDLMKEEVKERLESSIYAILNDSENVVRNSLMREHREQEEEMRQYADKHNK